MDCKFCDDKLKDEGSLIRHLKEYHATEQNLNIPCGDQGCTSIFKNDSSRRSHISRKHNKKLKLSEPPNISSNVSINNDIANTETMTTFTESTTQEIDNRDTEAISIERIDEAMHVNTSNLNTDENVIEFIKMENITLKSI